MCNTCQPSSPSQLVLNQVQPVSGLVQDPRVQVLVGSLIDQCPVLANQQFDIVFHLAAALSAECEADFAWVSDRTWIAHAPCWTPSGRPAIAHALCLPVLRPFSAAILACPCHRSSATIPSPRPRRPTASKKFICEQLVADYTRKRFIDGRSPCLMTVIVRPGQPRDLPLVAFAQKCSQH
jgi:D-erythronate 2-dehydrogenase